MAKKITYNSIKVMEPRDGRGYATTYYQQNHQQRQETLDHIQHVVSEISQVCSADIDMKDWIQKPLKRFGKTTSAPNYSLIEIVSDMAEQLEAGKDIPSGMLGRWNRLFNDTPWDIELEEYVSPREERMGVFNDLFEAN